VARIAIIGGTGFVGIHTSKALRAAGHDVRLVARGVHRGPRPQGVELVRADVSKGEGLSEALRGCDVVVHLVAIIRERGRQTFDRVNHRGAANVAQAAADAGVPHAVHISALGADPDPRFAYLASKWAGEEAVKLTGVPWTVLRPSILFGPGDGFFTVLAKLVRRNPVIPIVGDGRTLFQPLAVADLARVITSCVERGPSHSPHELGGPDQLSYEEIVDVIKTELGVHRLKAHVPVPAMLPAALLMDKLLPNPPVTPGQLRLLAKDNVTWRDAVPRQFGFTAQRFAEHCGYLHDY
jgi:uncharacterized protein YbjT (DUF2867 family)